MGRALEYAWVSFGLGVYWFDVGGIAVRGLELGRKWWSIAGGKASKHGSSSLAVNIKNEFLL